DDYVGNHLEKSIRGSFGNNSRTRIVDITDGTSTTIAVGEAKQLHNGSGGTNVGAGANYGPYWGAGVHTAVHGTVANNPNYHINFPYGVCPPPKSGYQCQRPSGFGSWHVGGANFVFCDGSVRFLPETLEFQTFRALNSMNGGETI